MYIRKTASTGGTQRTLREGVDNARRDKRGENDENLDSFRGKLAHFENISSPGVPPQFKRPLLKQKAKFGLTAAHRDVIGCIGHNLFASDLYSFSRAGKIIRNAIDSESLWSAVISVNLQKVSTLAKFRRLLRIGTPPASRLAETLRRTRLEPKRRDELLKHLPWRILSLPQGEQKDAAQALLSVAKEQAGRSSAMFDSSVVSANMTAEQVISTLKAKEAEVVARARDACAGCKRAQDVRDVATELGVSSPAGIEKLKQYAAEARVAGGDKPDVVATELQISGAARSDLDRHVMAINGDEIHSMLADGHPEEEIENRYGLKRDALRKLSVVAAPMIGGGAVRRRA